MTERCDLCALNIIYPQENPLDSKEVDAFFIALRELQKAGEIKKGWPRNVRVSNAGSGDKSTICAINSKHYRPKKKNTPCPHFMLYAGLSISDALSLHAARNTDALTAKIHFLTWAALFFTSISVLVSVFQLINN